MSEGKLTINVAEGERFVPRLFAELGVPIHSVSVAAPTLDDVFMSITGRTIRDAEASVGDRFRAATVGFRQEVPDDRCRSDHSPEVAPSA
jgi:ABC-2 type transport system ATP-binding protein